MRILWLSKIKRIVRNIFVVSFMVLLLGSSNLPPADNIEKIRAYTRDIEFDYVNWTFNALKSKASQLSMNLPEYVPSESQHDIVVNYLNLVQQLNHVKSQIELIYSDPNTTNHDISVSALIEERDSLQQTMHLRGPLTESIIQEQASSIIAELGLGIEGQPVPPVLYEVSSTPLALIISPRNIIRQDADISLLPDLTVEQVVDLENNVERSQNVSALVVEIGGIGLYPTMITSSTDLPWLLETVCHEWTHNYLSLRPLGVNYYSTPQLRTMNETTANIAGKEISRAILKQYYPEYLPPTTPPETQPTPSTLPSEDQGFDFRKEMHLTRVTVDQMLANNEIEKAEDYMEARRRIFLENGYFIRRLNQAYFAFHGAYADEPGGAAGADPVGPAVRALRQKSETLAEFLYRISWMTSFNQLQRAVNQ